MKELSTDYDLTNGTYNSRHILIIHIQFVNIFVALVLSSMLAYGQKTSKDDYTGDWNDNNSWTGGTAPDTTNIGNADLDLNVYGYISRINGDQNLSFSNVNADAAGPNFIINDTLVVYGNLSFANKAANLVVQSGAVLIVLGDFSAINFINVENGGIFVVAGTMSFSNSGNDEYTGSGDLYAGSITGNEDASNSDNGLAQLETDYPEIYDFINDGGAYPLPVEIIYFRANIMLQTVLLEWGTIVEENLDYFTIQRSKDGISFMDYAWIYDSKNSNTPIREYEFTDEMPFQGRSYYRLKATDIDGDFEYHGIVTVNIDDINPQLLIYPNPIIGNQITTSYSGNSEESFNILTIKGRIIETGTVIPGICTLFFNTALEPGIYILRIEERPPISEKFIVR